MLTKILHYIIVILLLCSVTPCFADLRIPEDKFQHFSIGFMMGTASTCFVKANVEKDNILYSLIPFGAVVCTGIFKEYADISSNPWGKFDWGDVIWTTAGGVLAITIVW